MHCYISLYITGFFTSLQSTFIYIISLFDRLVGERISEVAVITVVWYIHLASSCYSRARLQQWPPLTFLLHCFPLFHAHWVLPFSAHTFLPSWKLSGPPLHPACHTGFALFQQVLPFTSPLTLLVKVTDDLHVAKSRGQFSVFILQRLTQLITLFSLQ